MTGVAPHGCLALLVAVDAPFHLQGLLKRYDLLRRDIAVTPRTLDLRCRMRTVAEEDKARQLVDELQTGSSARRDPRGRSCTAPEQESPPDPPARHPGGRRCTSASAARASCDRTAGPRPTNSGQGKGHQRIGKGVVVFVAASRGDHDILLFGLLREEGHRRGMRACGDANGP